MEDRVVVINGVPICLTTDREANEHLLLSKLRALEGCILSLKEDIRVVNEKNVELKGEVSYLQVKLAKKNWERIPLWIKKLFGIHNLSPIV